ncbi:hypothetical protein D9M68_645110 [compost metagenome]
MACFRGAAMPGSCSMLLSLAGKGLVWSYCMAIMLCQSCLALPPASSAMRSARSG